MKSAVLLAAAVTSALFLGTARAHADVTTLALWNFDNNPPTTAGPVAPDSGTGSATSVHSGSPAFSNVTNNTAASGNGSAHCWGSTDWNVNETNYWEFQTSSVGFGDIQLSYDQVSSNTGPNAFALQYSTDGTTFTPVVTLFTDANGVYTVHPNSTLNGINYAWSSTTPNANDHYAFDLSSIGDLNDASTLYFRIVVEATAQASDTTKTSISGSGVNFIDNVTISGTSLAAAPEPATLSMATVGAVALLARRKKCV